VDAEDDPPLSRRALALERAQAAAVLLPSFVVAWPGPFAPLAGDLLPATSAAGWALPAALPAGLLVLARRAWHAPLSSLAYVAFLVAGALAAFARVQSDTLEASRAAHLGLATLLTLAGGASLEEEGRRWLASGLVLLAALALLPALPGLPAAPHGALGNTAATSELALGGLLVAASALAHARGLALLAAATLLVLGVAHAALAPVLSTLALLAVGLLVLPLARGGEAGRRRWLVALAFLAALTLALRHAGDRSPAPDAAVAAPGGDTGGLEVRARIARASLALLADHALLGVGRGQFASAFPPYRDAREIELSSHGHRLVGQTTEVEHPHDDWLLGLLETGLVGGVAWLVFLSASALAAWRALRDGERALGALGLAGLGWLAAALARAPLLVEPAAATTAFAVLGAVAGAAAPRRAAWRLVLNAALVAALLALPRALALQRHGRALAEVALGRAAPYDAAQRALAHCPDSVVARAMHARHAPAAAAARGAERSFDAVAAWRAVLELRPEHFEAWMETGNAWARAGRYDPARAAYLRAHALDGTDPALRRNLARLEVQAGDARAALRWADELQREGRLPAGWHEGAVAEAARRLQPAAARELLGRARPQWTDLSTQALWERAREEREAAPELAAALEGLAHLEWAREHVAGGDAPTAVRSYRQALRCLADPANGKAPAVLRLELAAALLRAGAASEGAEEAAAAGATAQDWAALPDWAGQELMAAGWIGR
jgi:hypothetical protein